MILLYIDRDNKTYADIRILVTLIKRIFLSGKLMKIIIILMYLFIVMIKGYFLSVLEIKKNIFCMHLNSFITIANKMFIIYYYKLIFNTEYLLNYHVS